MQGVYSGYLGRNVLRPLSLLYSLLGRKQEGQLNFGKQMLFSEYNGQSLDGLSRNGPRRHLVSASKLRAGPKHHQCSVSHPILNWVMVWLWREWLHCFQIGVLLFLLLLFVLFLWTRTISQKCTSAVKNACSWEKKQSVGFFFGAGVLQPAAQDTREHHASRLSALLQTAWLTDNNPTPA